MGEMPGEDVRAGPCLELSTSEIRGMLPERNFAHVVHSDLQLFHYDAHLVHFDVNLFHADAHFCDYTVASLVHADVPWSLVRLSKAHTSAW